MSERSVVIDSSEAPVQTWAASGDTSWAGASQGREMEDWNPSVGSADADLLPEIDDLRLRSRDADRKFPVAHSALEAIVTNVVGPGLLCIPDVDYEALGKDREWGIRTNKLLKRRARAFLRSAGIDATGIDNFNGLTSLVYRSVKTSGGIIALAVYSPDGLSGYGTKIHLVEIDRVSSPPGEQNGPNYRDGIGFDEYGKEQFFDIQNAHPGDSMIGYDPEAFTWTRIPAETSWGRKRVLHVFDKERVDVSKGVSQLARVLPRLHTFDKLTQSTLQKEFSASLVALILKTNMNWEQVQKLFSSPEEYLKFRKANQPKLGTGSVLTVSPGEDVTAFSGARPGSDYDVFAVNIMREITAGMKIPFELGMRAFAGMNYSNARVMLSEAWRDFGTDRGWFLDEWKPKVEGAVTFIVKWFNILTGDFERATTKLVSLAGPVFDFLDKIGQMLGFGDGSEGSAGRELGIVLAIVALSGALSILAPMATIVAAITAAFVSLISVFGIVASWFTYVVGVSAAATGGMAAAWAAFWAGLLYVAYESVKWIIQNWDDIKKGWDALMGLLGALGRAGLDAVKGIFGGLPDFFKIVIDKVGKMFSALWDGVKAGASGAWNTVKGWFGGGTPPAMNDNAGGEAVPSFDVGGLVPGSPGAPRRAIVHGGERILTVAETGLFDRLLGGLGAMASFDPSSAFAAAPLAMPSARGAGAGLVAGGLDIIPGEGQFLATAQTWKGLKGALQKNGMGVRTQRARR